MKYWIKLWHLQTQWMNRAVNQQERQTERREERVTINVARTIVRSGAFEMWKRRGYIGHAGVKRENGQAAVIFLSGRTMPPLNGRHFAREYTIFKKSPCATLDQDLRRQRWLERGRRRERRVNPSIASNGRILRTEKRPFKATLSLSCGTNLAWKCEDRTAFHCASRDREMRFASRHSSSAMRGCFGYFFGAHADLLMALFMSGCRERWWFRPTRLMRSLTLLQWGFF